MATQNLKRKKNNNLKDQKRTRTSKVSAIIKPLSAKQTGKRAEEALKRSEEAAKRMAQENAAMAEIGRIISSTLDIKEVYERFAEEAHKLIPFDRIAINVANPDKCTTTVTYTTGVEIAERSRGKIIPLGGTLTEEVMRTRKSHLIQEEENEVVSRFPGLLFSFQSRIRSLMAIPLISKDVVIGVLHLRSTKPKAYTEEHLKIAERVCNQIAGAIANAQLFNELKRAEEVLRQESSFRTSIIDHVTEGLCVCNETVEFPHAAFTVWNDRMIEITGYSMDEINRLGWYQTMYPDPEVQARAIERMARMRQGDDIVGEEWEITCADGEKRLLSISTSVLQSGDGIPHVLALMQDITERKQREEEIRHTLSLLNATLESTADGILVVNKEGKIESFNRKFVQMWRIPESVITTQDDNQALAFVLEQLKDPEVFIAKVKELYNQPEAESFDLLEFKDGRFFERYSQPQWIGEQSVGRVWSFRDVTERKEAEEALQRSEKDAKRLAQENAIVAEIGRIISSTLNIEEVYERFAGEACKLIPFDGIAINIVNHNDGTVTVPYVSGIDVPGCQPGDIFPLEGSVTGEVMRMHSGMIIQTKDRKELQTCFPTLLTAFDTGLRSVIAVPLISKDQVIGAIHFRSTKPNAYSDQNLKLAENIAFQVAGAIANAQLFIERKRAGEALRQSEEKYRTILENIEEGYFEVDLAGKFTFFNDPLRRMLGYSKDEMMGMNNRQYTDQENAQKLYQAFNKVYRTGEPTKEFDWEVIRKDGTKRYIETSVSLVKNPSSQPIGFRGTVRDITERKQAEEALKASEANYRAIFDTANDAIFIHNMETGEILDVNRKMCEMYGYTLEEAQRINVEVLSSDKPPYTQEDALRWIKKAVEGYPQLFEWRAKDKDGRLFWVEVNLKRATVGGKERLLAIVRDITERKKVEEAFAQSGERYRTLVEESFDGIFIQKYQKIVFANRRLYEMLGYEEGELVGRDHWLVYHPDFQELTRERALSRIREEKVPSQYEVKLQRKDGTSFDGEINARRIMFDDEPGIQVWVRDITERKRAEDALRESEERYRNILSNIEDGYYEVDIAGNLTFFNNSLCKILGYPEEETMGMNNRVYMDKETAQRVYQAYNKVYTTSEPLKAFGYKIIRKDGTERFLESHVSLLKNEKGKRIGFRGIARDMTERKQAEEALRESEERYRTILENIEDGYYEVDLPGNFTFFNDSLCRMLGYSRDEMIGMGNQQYTDEENRKKLFQAFNEVYRTGEPAKGFDWQVIKKDGTKVFGEVSVSLIKDPKGQRVGFRGIARDITERKRSEQEMAALQEQFRQSQKMEAVGRLGGGIAHDFNNLLTIIKGYSQLSLLDLKENDPLWGNIQEIQKATQRATDLTRQLLAFSRRQILDLKVLDLNTLLRELDKMLRRIIGEDIELVNLLSVDLGRIKIDPGQIEQVIFNLAVNARDAMPSGGKLLIETTNVELDKEYANAHIGVVPGRYVKLSVSDTGIGMSQEVRGKVFEPFFTTKDKGKGTGLGLSTVYGTVKQSGGNIWVYSEPGHGTTFKIYLPRVEEELDILHGQDETESSSRGSETVLLVEDEPLVRDLAHRILSQQGYKVLEAANGEEALRVAHEHGGEEIHLLLTDVVMPQMGGKDLADQLKIPRPDIKVLYTSGYTDNAIVHHGVLEPGIHFLQKPFSSNALSHKVREVLDR